MRIAYFEPFSGASGDMTLGALIDAGAPLEQINAQLQGLNLPGAEVADTILLTPDGALADTLGRLIGVGASRGIGLMLVLVAAGLLVVAVAIPRLRSIAELDTHLRQSTAQTKEI